MPSSISHDLEWAEAADRAMRRRYVLNGHRRVPSIPELIADDIEAGYTSVFALDNLCHWPSTILQQHLSNAWDIVNMRKHERAVS